MNIFRFLKGLMGTGFPGTACRGREDGPRRVGKQHGALEKRAQERGELGFWSGKSPGPRGEVRRMLHLEDLSQLRNNCGTNPTASILKCWCRPEHWEEGKDAPVLRYSCHSTSASFPLHTAPCRRLQRSRESLLQDSTSQIPKPRGRRGD